MQELKLHRLFIFNSNMKLFLKKLLVASIIVIISYLILLILWGTFLPAYFNKNFKYKLGLTGFMHSRLDELEQTEPKTILFLGSSHTYRGFDTRIFENHGYSCFNLGSSNQTPMQTKILIESYLETVKPKFIIYEVFPENFEMDGVESAIDIISNTKDIKLACKSALQVNHIIAYNTLIYSIIRKYIFNDLAFEEPDKINNDYYISNGFVETSINKNLYLEKLETKNNNWKISNKQWVEFIETIQIIKSKNIDFILIQAPISKEFYNSYENNNEIDNTFNKIGTFLNCNDIPEIKLSDSLDFYDFHHLTQSGVVKFNTHLIKILEERKIIGNGYKK